MSDYDLLVIGGGPGGLGAARAAVRRGAVTLLVSDGAVGGDCTFKGCIPSKALLAAAARGESFTEAMASVRRAVETMAAADDDDALKRDGVDVIHGSARFESRREVWVDDSLFDAKRVVIATGSAPAIPRLAGLKDLDVLTSENVFDLPTRPLSLAVLGGGSTGCEIAQAFARLGTRVTLIESAARILPNEEPEASEAVTEALVADGVAVRAGEKITRVDARPARGAARLHTSQGEALLADRVFIATGRAPRVDGLDLRAAGIATDRRGFVVADEALRTSARGVYAAGDVVGALQLTHAADEMGRIAAANALGRRRTRFRSAFVPWATFTDPEVGRVGLTEDEAIERRGRVAFLPMTEVDRAVCENDARGFVKLVVGPRLLTRNAGGGRLLGATVVARRGGELINEAALAMRRRMRPGRLAQSSHAYPTWSSALQKAAAQLFFEIDGRVARPAGG